VARWSSTSRRRLGVGAAGVLLAAALSGCVPYGSAGADGAGAGEQIVVCESAPVTDGGVGTSSASASRVAAGTPVPEGCRIG